MDQAAQGVFLSRIIRVLALGGGRGSTPILDTASRERSVVHTATRFVALCSIISPFPLLARAATVSFELACLLLSEYIVKRSSERIYLPRALMAEILVASLGIILRWLNFHCSRITLLNRRLSLFQALLAILLSSGLTMPILLRR